MKQPFAYRYLPAELAERLRNHEITVRRPVHGPLKGQHRSPHFGSSVEFAEYRAYAAGDPINLIDWAVYARSDRYMIRRFHEETNLRAYVMLDTSESLAFQDEGTAPKMEYASFLASGLMYTLVNQGDGVALMTFDDRIRKTYEPVASFEGLRPMLLGIEEVKPSGRSDIEAAIHEASGLIRSRSLVVIVSDLLQDPARVGRGIRHLYHDGHNIMVLHVLDRGEMRLSLGGVAELRELETGRRLVIELDEVREAYGEAVGRYLTELRATCAECLADYHLMDTRVPIEEAFSALQGRRAG